MPIPLQNLPLLSIDPGFQQIDPSSMNLQRGRTPESALSLNRPPPMLASTSSEKSTWLRDLGMAALLTSPAWLTMLLLKMPKKRRFG